MRRFLLTAATMSIVALGMATPVLAGDHHDHDHDHGRYDHGRHYDTGRDWGRHGHKERTSLVFNFGFPQYYSPKYQTLPAYYPAPVPYNYQAPRTIYVQARPEPERYCREFTQQVRVGNRIHDSYGTACLQPDGSWQVVP